MSEGYPDRDRLRFPVGGRVRVIHDTRVAPAPAPPNQIDHLGGAQRLHLSRRVRCTAARWIVIAFVAQAGCLDLCNKQKCVPEGQSLPFLDFFCSEECCLGTVKYGWGTCVRSDGCHVTATSRPECPRCDGGYYPTTFCDPQNDDATWECRCAPFDDMSVPPDLTVPDLSEPADMLEALDGGTD